MRCCTDVFLIGQMMTSKSKCFTDSSFILFLPSRTRPSSSIEQIESYKACLQYVLIRDISVHLIPYRANVIHQNLRTNDLDNHRLRNYNLNKYNIIEQKNINTKHLHPLMQSSMLTPYLDLPNLRFFSSDQVSLIGTQLIHLLGKIYSRR